MESKDRARLYRERHEVKKSHEKYTGEECKDYVECKLCGKRSFRIDLRHLANRHGISKDKYLTMFPQATMYSDYFLTTQTDRAVGNKANLGKKFTDEHCKKISNAVSGSNNGAFGKIVDEKTKEKAKDTRTNTTLRRYNVNNVMHIQEIAEKVSLSRTNAILSGKIIYNNSIYKNGFFYSAKNNAKFYYRSSSELDFMKILESDKNVFTYRTEPFSIIYEFENKKHRYIPDFLINNKDIVEIKADFMIQDNKTKCKSAAAIEFAKQNGYTYTIVKSSSIKRMIQIGS
jgi:hypothetical protein